MKTMKIWEFHARITKTMQNLRDPRKNNENHVTLIIPRENLYTNNENLRIQSENHENYANHKIPFDNQENYENLKI